MVEQGFHRRQSHDLNKLLKSITKESDNAVEIIVACMKSTEEKMRFNAATKLLDLQVEVAEHINRDQMQRLIANARFKGPPELAVEDDDTPQIDFNEIQEV